MKFTETTIYDLFCSQKVKYIIPVYQRAYSWEELQWKTFLEDLKDQINGNNPYSYGNILLEVEKSGQEYEVIDGQQRLTTIVIFFRCILDLLDKRQKNGEAIVVDGDDFSMSESSQIYLKYKSNVKLRPVAYDCAFFDNYIIEDNDDLPKTPSQQRIKSAKDYFSAELSKLETIELIKIFEKISSTSIMKIELEGKKESALMFELQNNRGKNLTNMEKLKSYFMYQLYVYSDPDEVNDNIEYLSNLYSEIYEEVNLLRGIDEDNVLVRHCQAWVNGFTYRSIDEVKSKFKRESGNKVEWIRNFVYELSRSFEAIRLYFESTDESAVKLRAMSPSAFIYPFIIRGYHYNGDDLSKISRLFRILSVVDFRDKLVNTRANLESRLNSIISVYEGDNDKLINDLNDKFESEVYWSEANVAAALNGYMYGNPALKNILSEYEDSLQNKGYRLAAVIENPSIEHISPQTPNDEKLAKGYEVDSNGNYSEDFENNCLNCIGNLMYISQSHNSSIGNKPFVEKLNSYNTNPLFNQQAEIKDFVDPANPCVWDSKCIERRKQKIVSFSLYRWDLKRV